MKSNHTTRVHFRWLALIALCSVMSASPGSAMLVTVGFDGTITTVFELPPETLQTGEDPFLGEFQIGMPFSGRYVIDTDRPVRFVSGGVFNYTIESMELDIGLNRWEQVGRYRGTVEDAARLAVWNDRVTNGIELGDSLSILFNPDSPNVTGGIDFFRLSLTDPSGAALVDDSLVVLPDLDAFSSATLFVSGQVRPRNCFLCCDTPVCQYMAFGGEITNFAIVPEPGTAIFLGLGLAGLSVRVRVGSSSCVSSTAGMYSYVKHAANEAC